MALGGKVQCRACCFLQQAIIGMQKWGAGMSDATYPPMAESGTPEADALAKQAREEQAISEQCLLLGQILGSILRLEPALCAKVLERGLAYNREVTAILALRAEILKELASTSAVSDGPALSRARAIRRLGAVFHAAQQLEGKSLEALAADPAFLYANQARLVVGLRESLDDAGHGRRGAGLLPSSESHV